MRPLHRAMFLIVATAFAANVTSGQPSVDAPPAPLPSPTSAPASMPPTAPASRVALPAATTDSNPPETVPTALPVPDRARPMSALMAARLAERMPKFTPPKPGEPVTSPVVTDAKAAEPDPAATDRPRNTIVRLPNYVVQEEKPEAFKERNLLTGWGRLQLAYKRHPGLHIGSLPILSNDGIGLFMLEEEDRLERKAEMEELVTVITTPAERAKAKAALHDTFIRKE